MITKPQKCVDKFPKSGNAYASDHEAKWVRYDNSIKGLLIYEDHKKNRCYIRKYCTI